MSTNIQPTSLLLRRFATLVAFASCVALASGQKKDMPREDVIEVSAIGEGLCVHNLFQSNMVLQRDKQVAIWGWASPREKVSVSFAGQTKEAKAGKGLAWKVALPDRSEWPPAPVTRTGQTRTHAKGDDGYHQRGMPWPDPRFTDNDDGTVTDNLTGLIWLKTASRGLGSPPWEKAVSICNELAEGSNGLADGSVRGDWRLANLREIASLMDYSQSRPALPPRHPFDRVTLASHWASTTHPISTNAGFRFATQSGLFGGFSGKSHGKDPVWPVRGGYNARASATAKDTDAQPAKSATAKAQAAPAPVLRTGQTRSFSVGDDGYHQRGLPLVPPNDIPRFTDNKDGTVTDNLTGLIWLKAGGGSRVVEHWAAALAFCNGLKDGAAGLSDNSRPGDWRLPNARELHSLIDYAKHDPPLPAGHPFTKVLGGPHWSSTTSPGDPDSAYSMNLREGRLWIHNKQTHEYVWPVRGGL